MKGQRVWSVFDCRNENTSRCAEAVVELANESKKQSECEFEFEGKRVHLLNKEKGLCEQQRSRPKGARARERKREKRKRKRDDLKKRKRSEFAFEGKGNENLLHEWANDRRRFAVDQSSTCRPLWQSSLGTRVLNRTTVTNEYQHEHGRIKAERRRERQNTVGRRTTKREWARRNESDIWISPGGWDTKVKWTLLISPAWTMKSRRMSVKMKSKCEQLVNCKSIQIC